MQFLCFTLLVLLGHQALTSPMRVKNQRSLLDLRPAKTFEVNSTIPVPIPVENALRIIGGQPTSIEEFPWQVYLNVCGGSIISMAWIMSAAHCFCKETEYDYFEIDVTRINVFAGLTDRSKKYSDPDVQHRIINKDEFQGHLFVHPDYKKGAIWNKDIALIKLKDPLTFNEKVQPIDYADVSDYIPGKELITSGWGQTADDEGGPYILRYVDGLNLISKEECKEAFGIHATDKNICHKTKDKNMCKGDSGGPVICGIGNSNGPPYVQIGINSFVSGWGCEAYYPGAFTDVSQFRQWIYGITEVSQGCGGIYTTSNGVIRHPLGGGHYENNQNCIWEINAAESIKITVVRMDLEEDWDFLYIWDGSSDDSPLIGNFTGSTIPNAVQTNHNSAYLRFSSDKSITWPGFEIRWEPASTNC